jgi:hypothetical protein
MAFQPHHVMCSYWGDLQAGSDETRDKVVTTLDVLEVAFSEIPGLAHKVLGSVRKGIPWKMVSFGTGAALLENAHPNLVSRF